MRELLRYARPHAGTLLAGLVVALGSSAAGLAQPLVAKRVIDALAGREPLAGPLLALGVLLVLGAALGAAGTLLMGRTAERVVLGVRRDLAHRLLRLRLAELDRSSPGDLISRATADSSLLHAATTTAPVELVTGVVGMVGAVALMGTLDLRLLGVSLLVLVLVGVLVGVVAPRLRRALTLAQTAVGALGSALDRALGAARTARPAAPRAGRPRP